MLEIYDMQLRVVLVPAVTAIFGCADPADVADPSSAPVRVSAQVVADVHEAIADEPDVCSKLPSCGPCSLACDPEKLAQEYVPKGACALFLCTLTDGSTIEVDACNVGDDCTARLARPNGAATADPTCGVRVTSVE